MTTDDLQWRKAQLTGQYNLDNLSAKISALSSGDIDKYEKLTDTHLGIRPSNVDKVRFEYSPLRCVINKGVLKKLDTIAESTNKFADEIDLSNEKYTIDDNASNISDVTDVSDDRDVRDSDSAS